jgi:hypothetical protein
LDVSVKLKDVYFLFFSHFFVNNIDDQRGARFETWWKSRNFEME